jgi:hypothetical protein
MRTFRKAALCAIALGIAGCVNYGNITESRNLEQDTAASCRRWDAMAYTAAHPDEATIVEHDRLVKKAADLEASAVGLHGQALDAAIKEIAQAQIDADAVYDAKGKQEVADSCWAMLGVAREQNRAGEQELQTRSLEALGNGLQSMGNDMRATADAYRAGAAAIAASPPPLPPPPIAPSSTLLDLGAHYLRPPSVPGYCMTTPIGLTMACPH